MMTIYILLCWLFLVGVSFAQSSRANCALPGATVGQNRLVPWSIAQVPDPPPPVGSQLEEYITIEGKWPADPIVINVCDTLILTVTNNLPTDLIILRWYHLTAVLDYVLIIM
jgi:hypothetical protein